MTVNSTGSPAGQPAAADAIATPLTQLDRKQRDKVTSELRRIHEIVSSMDEVAHKDKCDDKSDRGCTIDFKPQRD
jgi:hypothetical protein